MRKLIKLIKNWNFGRTRLGSIFSFKMSESLQFDADKYYSPHEPKHHWELRKKFLVNNMGRYPENKLVCLAQTFANIEFMGCR